MRKNKSLTILSCGLLVIALCSTLFLDDVWGGRISEIITIATALIGAVALFFQFKRDKDINQASFIIEYGKTFTETPGCHDVMMKLDKYRLGETDIFEKSKTKDDDYAGIVAYLEWCESLSVLIQKGVMDLETVDNLYSYRFFLIVNNKYVQEKELIPEREFYKGVFALHKIWADFKRKTNQEIMLFESDLSKSEYYNEYVAKGDFYNHKKY